MVADTVLKLSIQKEASKSVENGESDSCTLSDNPVSNRPIRGRLIYNRIKPVIESVLPEEQAGFRPSRCTLDQVALLTEDIEASFDKKLKVGVFVDLFVDLRVNHAVKLYSEVFHAAL